MSDLPRYRRLYVRLWEHGNFQALTDAEKVTALYLLTGPQTNRIGYFKLSINQAAEDLGTVPQTLSKRIANCCTAFGWMYDTRARVFFVPSWFKWNPPANENVIKGSLKDLSELPPSGLITAFAQTIETVPETLREPFMEGLRKHAPTGMPNQDQYQERNQNPDQEQKHAARRAGFERKPHGGSSSNGDGSDVPAHLVATARETLKLTNANGPLEDLVDAFKLTLRNKQLGDCSTSEAQSALTIALAERRVS